MTKKEVPSFNKVTDEEINSINSRVKEAYEHLEYVDDLPITVFAKKIGMTTSFQLKKIWNNENLISTRNLFLLKKHFNININWVFTGEGEMIGIDKEKELEEKINRYEDDANQMLRVSLKQEAEIDELKKRFKNLYSLIEKLNEGGVFDVKLDEY